MSRIAFRALLVLIGGAGLARGAEPSEAITIRWIKPDRQLERLLALFDGARAPSPAAALAAWKRATRDPKGLGKPLEAAIAALNPGMVRELRALDEARVGLGFDPEDGKIRWYAVAPQDDGALSALATALMLTDGGAEPPLEGVPIDRLGPPGSVVEARVPGVVTIAGSRADLPAAVRQAGVDVAVLPDVDSGWHVRLDPSHLAPSGPLSRRRAIEAIHALGIQSAEAITGLEGDSARLSVTCRFEAGPLPAAVIEPAWLDWLPASGVVGAFAIAIDARPETWKSTFALADRVERVDPARAQVAPLRTRLNLIASAAYVRLEVDFWPKLRGISGCALADPEGALGGALIALHVSDEAAAERIATQVLPRLAAARIQDRGTGPAEGPKGVRRIARVSGRPLSVTRRGTTVLVGWGEGTLQAGLDAQEHPERSAAPSLRSAWGETPPRRAGAFWPGRLRGRLSPETPPIVWSGRDDGATTVDVVRWEGLREVVRGFLERLPLDLPPDR